MRRVELIWHKNILHCLRTHIKVDKSNLVDVLFFSVRDVFHHAMTLQLLYPAHGGGQEGGPPN